MFDIKDLVRDEKRAGYRELCGTPHRLGDGKGGVRLVRFYCHQDECETCRKIKGESYMDRVMGVLGAGKKVIRMDLPNDIAETVKKNHGKDEYMSLPQLDGSVVLFVSVDDDTSTNDSMLVSESNIDNMNWAEITRRVDGRKISGTLGRPAARHSDDEDVTTYAVEDAAYLVNDHSLAAEVSRQVIQQTYVINVKDENGMQDLVSRRNQIFEQLYREKGGMIIAVFHKTVRVSGFDVNNNVNDNIETHKERKSDFNRKSFAVDQAESGREIDDLIRDLCNTG